MKDKTPTVDDLAKGFLGVASDREVQVVRGQKADPKRQQALYEQQLAKEACDFGDLLVNYVGAHTELTPAQRAFGTMLGVLNLRRDYPEGGESFDALADLGGEDLKLSSKSTAGLPAPPALTPTTQLPGAQFAEAFVRYVTMKKQQYGVSNPQAAYALGRMFHNLRLTFPPEDGGEDGFDLYGRQAGEYFDRG
jgi:hypothetical protein